MKYEIGDKVIINNDVSVVYSIIDTDYVALYRIGKAGKHIKWMKEEDLSPAGNLVDSEEATEEFQQKAEEGYFDEIDEPLMTNEQWERIQKDLRTREHQRKAETGYFDETDKSFKTDE